MLPRVGRAKTSLKTPRRINNKDDPTIVPAVVGKKATIPQNQNTKYVKVVPKRKIPDNPNVKRIEDFKIDCEKVIKLSLDFIDSNSATPEISQAILVPLAKFQNTLPIYYESTHKFFETFAKLQSITQTTQIVSTQSIRTPVLNFTKAWERFVVAFNKMKNGDNIPHAHLVISKFDQIKMTLDFIDKSNNERKYPNSNVTNCTRSLKLLCDNISGKVVDLFRQPIFPFFEEDVYSSYKSTIKSFVHLINEAFMNELPQSGMTAVDLNRHKQSIVLDCSDIIKSLRTSFDYPTTIKELSEIIVSIENQRKIIDEQFNFPNNVVHPILQKEDEEEQNQGNEKQSEQNSEPEIVKEIINEDNDLMIKEQEEFTIEERCVNTPIIDVESEVEKLNNKKPIFDEKIMRSIFKKIEADYREEETIDEMLTIIEMNLDGLIERNSVITDENKLFAKKIEKLESELNELKVLYNDKSKIMTDEAKTKIDNEQKMAKELKELRNNEDELNRKIFILETKLSQATKNDDAIYLRESMMRIAKKVSDYFKTSFESQKFVGKKDSKDGDLVNYILKFFDKDCQECKRKNNELEKIKKELNDILITEKTEEIETCLKIIREKFKDYEEMENILTNEINSMTDSLEMILRFNGKINEPFELTSQNATIGKIQKRMKELMDDNQNLNDTIDSFLCEIVLMFPRDTPISRQKRMDFIREIICEMKAKIEKKKEKIKIKKGKIENLKTKVSLLSSFVSKYFNLSKPSEIIAKIKEGINPIEELIESYKDKMDEIVSKSKGICARILGLVNLDFDPETKIEMLISTTNDVCDSLQDDREKIIKEREESDEEMKKIRNCLCFCDLHLRDHVKYLPADVDLLTNDHLIKRVQEMVIKIDNLEYSGRYIQKSQIESSIMNVMNVLGIPKSGNLINILNTISNRCIVLENTSKACVSISINCSGFDISKISELHHSIKVVDREKVDKSIMSCIDKLVTIIDMSSTQTVCKALGIST